MTETDDMNRAGDPAAAGWRPRTLPGFAGLVGPLWTRKEGTTWAYGLLAGIEHTNPAGVVHGGLLTTLIDHALSAIAWEAVGRRPCVTVQLDTHFLQPARAGDFLEARGRVVRLAGSLVFMQGAVSVGGADVVVASSLLKVVGMAGPRAGTPIAADGVPSTSAEPITMQNQTQSAGRTASGHTRLITSDRVEGTDVYSSSGDKLGTVDHLVIDKLSGQVSCAVLEFGGFLGMGEDRYPLPWSMLKYDTEKEGYVVPVTKERLEGAPSYKSGERPHWTGDYEAGVSRYYSTPT